MINKIEFTCWQSDEPIEIQLEPEAIIFIVSPENTITFTGTSTLGDFKWAIRIDHAQKGIQLFPESDGHYSIEIFENNKLLENWYKYM
ncbi:hypothetical protein [Foetidibacter luteolus]|uniref:hypothetical protein n=1 Tax=Foetidibacter luteolus TaxID=2608880 RepID=UPI00129AA193|nr:hypothetical protein [Foetidibacter luteolus]